MEKSSARSAPLTLIFAAFFVTATTRGVFETYFSKEIGYFVQLLLLLVLGVACVASGRIATPRLNFNIIVLYLFGLFAFASAAYVVTFRSFSSPWIYLIVMLVFSSGMALFASYEFPEMAAQPLLGVLALVGVILVLVAVLQQYGGQTSLFPGSDEAALQGVVRPASLTGSYLHYPLVMSLLVFVFLQAYSTLKRNLYLGLAAFFAVAVVISLSRSGAMILGIGVVTFALTSPSTSSRVRAGFIGLGSIAVLPLLSEGNLYTERLFSAVQANGLGNTGRIGQWRIGFDLWWTDSPLLIGAHTGEVTNATRNLGDAQSIVVESGFLQQLVNFGLIGTVLIYLLMIAIHRAIPKSCSWLRVGTLAGILQTFINQLIEMVSYMTPFCIDSLAAQHVLQRSSTKIGAEDVKPGLCQASPSNHTMPISSSM